MKRSTPTRTAPTAVVKPKSLTQQNNDFTSEGSPPPGQVGSALDPAPSKARTHAAKRVPSKNPR